MSETSKRKTILVVDDDEGLREAITVDFEMQGFEVFSAGNGKDAFQIIQQQNIDVVVSDIRMPDGAGISLLNEVRKLHPQKPVVILITGYADISMDQAYSQGADGVFTKPYNRKELFSTIQKALRPETERWSESENKSNSNQCIPFELPLPNLKFGRGGMFVELSRSTPGLDLEISFKLKNPTDDSKEDLRGTGIIRWIRTTSNSTGRSGVGIEFVTLSDDLRKHLLNIIGHMDSNELVPYIPAQ